MKMELNVLLTVSKKDSCVANPECTFYCSSLFYIYFYLIVHYTFERLSKCYYFTCSGQYIYIWDLINHELIIEFEM